MTSCAAAVHSEGPCLPLSGETDPRRRRRRSNGRELQRRRRKAPSKVKNRKHSQRSPKTQQLHEGGAQPRPAPPALNSSDKRATAAKAPCGTIRNTEHLDYQTPLADTSNGGLKPFTGHGWTVSAATLRTKTFAFRHSSKSLWRQTGPFMSKEQNFPSSSAVRTAL